MCTRWYFSAGPIFDLLLLYEGRDGMGLIWSMVPTPECPPGTRLFKKDINQPFRVQIGVVDQFKEVL